jgi:phage baseplate assembly protein W
MKTLALASGDLVVGGGGHQTISGARKIRQDMALALGEDYRADRFHPELGSVLGQYIGQPIDEETTLLVEAEVARVATQYTEVQQREVLRDHLAQRRSRFDASDVVTAISNVTAEISFDSIRVKADLTTLSGEQIQVSRTVTQ